MKDEDDQHVEITRLEFGVKDLPISKQIKMLELPIPEDIAKLLDLQHDLIVVQYECNLIGRDEYIAKVEKFSKSVASMLPGGKLQRLVPADEEETKRRCG